MTNSRGGARCIQHICVEVMLPCGLREHEAVSMMRPGSNEGQKV